MAVCVSLAFAIYTAVTHGTAAPPPSTDGRWRWVGASPGMNIYYAYRARSPDGVVSVWVDRRHFSNPAGIDKDLFDIWDVDCHHRRMRPGPGPGVTAVMSLTAESAWSTPRSGMPHERLLRSVCADVDTRELP